MLRDNSVPRLGLEHTVYCIHNGNKTYWIKWLLCFDTNRASMDAVLFTAEWGNIYASFINRYDGIIQGP